MTRFDLYEEHARAKAQLPPEWKAFKWECFPGGDETIYVAITGGITRHVYSSGKHKGRPNWKRIEQGSKRTVNLLVRDHDQFVENWELRTGNCAVCGATGRVVVRWSKYIGTEYRPCSRCGGTGKLPQVQEARSA